uniref:Uncharacterized protein n=1 Tax=Cyprinodon variegatus TaxID=28743 RepID=A0A3Q2D0G7_CYPVA
LKPRFERCLLLQKDLGRRLQVGQEISQLVLSQERCPGLDQDQNQNLLDRMVDVLAGSWVNSSNYKVRFGPFNGSNWFWD